MIDMDELTSTTGPNASPFEQLRHTDEIGECWSARDLIEPLGYERWEDFSSAISRAKESYRNAGQDPDQAFSERSEKGTGGRPRINYRLTRYACYLVAMNGDPRKPEIAAAQMYFAIKTREAETAPAALPGNYIEALKALVVAEEARQAAEVARLAAETAAKELEAPADAWNTLASGQGSLSVADTAKVLSNDHGIIVGPNQLFNRLNQLGWIYRGRSDQRWHAMQAAVRSGHLTEKVQSHIHPVDDNVIVDVPQVRITPRGLQRLLVLLRPAGRDVVLLG